MEAGRLNKRVTLERPSYSRDDVNQKVKKYTVVATVWGAVEPLRGREFFDSQKTSNEATTRIRIRYYPGISVDWRIVYEDKDRSTRYFGIVGDINPLEGRTEIQLICREMKTGEPV